MTDVRLGELGKKWRELADSASIYEEEAIKANYPAEKVEQHKRTKLDLSKCADELDAALARLRAEVQVLIKEWRSPLSANLSLGETGSPTYDATRLTCADELEHRILREIEVSK
jgi:hypothetical protein